MKLLKTTISVTQLLWVAFFYLLLPTIVFELTWMRLGVGAIACILAIYVGYHFSINLKKLAHSTLNLVELSVLFTLATVFALLSGVGGFSEQSYDFIGHVTKLNDLVINPWPFKYAIVENYPCYYFGYYLIPALLAKLVGSVAIVDFLWLAWTIIGLFLALTLTYLIANRKFSIFIYYVFVGGTIPMVHFLASRFLHTGLFNFSLIKAGWSTSSFFYSLIWVPNQLIPAIICCNTILLCQARRVFFIPVCLVACSFFWGPFPCVINVCLLLAAIFHNLKEGVQFLKTYWVQLLSLFFLFLPILIYLTGTSGSSINGLIWNSPYYKHWYLDLMLYLVVEFGIIYLPIYLLTRFALIDNNLRYFANISLFLGVLICFFYFGVWNDFMRRGTIPLIHIFSIVAALSIENQKFGIKKIVLICVILGASAFSLTRFTTQILHNKLVNQHKIYKADKDMYQVLLKSYSKTEATQYLLKQHSFFEGYLLKK